MFLLLFMNCCSGRHCHWGHEAPVGVQLERQVPAGESAPRPGDAPGPAAGQPGAGTGGPHADLGPPRGSPAAADGGGAAAARDGGHQRAAALHTHSATIPVPAAHLLQHGQEESLENRQVRQDL